MRPGPPIRCLALIIRVVLPASFWTSAEVPTAIILSPRTATPSAHAWRGFAVQTRPFVTMSVASWEEDTAATATKSRIRSIRRLLQFGKVGRLHKDGIDL